MNEWDRQQCLQKDQSDLGYNKCDASLHSNHATSRDTGLALSSFFPYINHEVNVLASQWQRKTYQRVCVGNLSCPIFLFSGNFISSSCSFKITPTMKLLSISVQSWETCTELSTKPWMWMRHMALNQAVVLFGSFLSWKGFCVWKIFFPLE